MLLPWSDIETVFLDMDGTLLDLHFDNQFWLEHLPRRYAENAHLSVEQAKNHLFSLFAEQRGLLNWYCVNYWSEKLELSIVDLKKELAHLIRWREHAELFLKLINQMGKEVILITNAHRHSLQLKMQKVDLAPWFTQIISSHDYGFPKENRYFWEELQQKTHFKTAHSLFIDDSLSVLKSAKQFGIKYLCSIYQPDSQQPPLVDNHEFAVIKDYLDCFPRATSSE